MKDTGKGEARGAKRLSFTYAIPLVDCPTQLTLIFMILIFVSVILCFMTNIKSANMTKHSREICYTQPYPLNPKVSLSKV